MIKSLSYGGKTFLDFTSNQLLAQGVPQDVVSAALSAEAIAAVNALRRAAYTEESDPLYMEWQYDKSAESEQAWRDKVAEIKARYPLPGE